MDKLKLIKNLVFVITFLLIAGSILLLHTLYRRAQTPSAPMPEVSRLGEPLGSNIYQFRLQDGLLYLLVRDGGLEDRIIIYDPQNAKRLSTVQLH